MTCARMIFFDQTITAEKYVAFLEKSNFLQQLENTRWHISSHCWQSNVIFIIKKQNYFLAGHQTDQTSLLLRGYGQSLKRKYQGVKISQKQRVNLWRWFKKYGVTFRKVCLIHLFWVFGIGLYHYWKLRTQQFLIIFQKEWSPMKLTKIHLFLNPNFSRQNQMNRWCHISMKLGENRQCYLDVNFPGQVVKYRILYLIAQAK